MRTMWLVIVLTCMLATSAAAKPQLESHAFGALEVQTPRGWVFTGDDAKGMAVAQQDPKRKDAAQLLVVIVRANAPTEDALIDSIAGSAAKDLVVVTRGPATGGSGKMLVADGTVDGIKVRLGAIAIGANGAAVLGVLIAKTGEFAGLGGTDLVVSVMASIKTTARAAAPPPPAAPPPSSGGGTALPAGKYACLKMTYTVNTTPTYVPTGISFELDGRGGYSATSFTGGPGAVSYDGNVMTFNGGALTGWHGYTGTISSGPYARIRLKDPKAIATSLMLGDGMCYLQH